jgi:hypothetical protein
MRGQYFGWALKEPANQYCDGCGNELDLYEEIDYSSKRYVVFNYPEYHINWDRMKETIIAN